MKLNVYNLVRLGRILKSHQPVGWHLYEQNSFVQFFLDLAHLDSTQK